MTYRTLSGLALAGALLPFSAGAETLDFLGFTDNVSDETAVEQRGSFSGAYDAGTPGFLPGDVLFDATYVPIETQLRGYSGSAATGVQGNAPYAYLDSNSAGAGVCKMLVGSQCDPSSDDNLTENEILGITLAEDVIFNAVAFRGEGHPNDPPFDDTDVFDVNFGDGGGWRTGLGLVNAKNGEVSFAGLLGPGTPGVFVEAGTEVLFGFNNEQYYVSALEVTPTESVEEIPLPAGFVLLLTGLGALAATRRRRA